MGKLSNPVMRQYTCVICGWRNHISPRACALRQCDRIL